ncbi:hypothetical protein HU200_048460 [Digitaria exilis]|uniref:Uncharacterized protein n=1 Tax=Digitaria exilis TaxID=1010633 RepID=A0A835B634_9POAL|nr:hypothetical protein HU200_048460 [Digitaria exilis]
MAEIDTRPLESVQTAVGIFDRGGDQSRLCQDRHEQEIAILTKELATCKLQLEVRESQHKQATLKIEALQKAVQDLSDQYEKDCMDAHMRIAQLEAENIAIMSRQAEADGERRALRGELAAARDELDEARASVAFVLREVEAMETNAILERESTKDALARILRLNETVLSSAVSAIRAEEERSVFFQEAMIQFLNSDKDLEGIRKQMERMEAELLAKTVEVEYLRSELKQVQACQTTVKWTDVHAKFTFQHSPPSPEECFVSEIFRKDDGHVTTLSDGNKTEIEISEDVVVADVNMVQDTTVLEENPNARETRCLVAEISSEDHHDIQSADENILAENNRLLQVQDHEDSKADASFVLESSRDDFHSVSSDAKDMSSIAEPSNVAIAGGDGGNQEPQTEAAPAPTSTSTPRECNAGTCAMAKEIVSKDEDEFCTKELEPEQPEHGGSNRLEGYVLVSKIAAGDGDAAAKDKQLDAAWTEISDLRFSLEEAVRRAELAEEAKAALERELREELRRKQQQHHHHTPSRPRRRAASDSEDAPVREGLPPPTLVRTRPTPSSTPGTTPSSSRALRKTRGEDMPTPRCLTLGKVLSMKYK